MNPVRVVGTTSTSSHYSGAAGKEFRDNVEVVPTIAPVVPVVPDDKSEGVNVEVTKAILSDGSEVFGVLIGSFESGVEFDCVDFKHACNAVLDIQEAIHKAKGGGQ